MKQNDLAQGGIGRLLFRYSWPALVAMSLNALYAVVDRVYIGQGCGAAAMAGLQLALPAMMFFTACGVFIGIGHSTLLSIRLGEGNRVACEKILGELVALKVLFSLVMPPLVFLNVDAVLNWCGGDRVSAEAFDCARTYLRIVVFSQVFSHIAFGLSAAMRSEGDAVRSMLCMVVGFGSNILRITFPFYFVYVYLQVFGDSLRSLEYSFAVMLTVLLNIGLLRVVLMYVLLHAFGTVEALVIVYPITWFTAAVSMAVLYIAKTKKLKKGEDSYETQIA